MRIPPTFASSFTSSATAQAVTVGRALVAAAALSLVSMTALAQTSGGDSQLRPDTPAEAAGKNTAVKALDDTRATTLKPLTGGKKAPPLLAPPPAPVTIGGGSAAPAAAATPGATPPRALALPGKCTPKAGSLDCVTDSAGSKSGEDVSGRVRTSVIGEVGAGRGATEGGKAKGQETCTPKAGELSCEAPASAPAGR